MNKKLTVICVGYNESVNLPKFFAAIESCKKILDITIHYIDQSSTDNSVDIAKKYTTYCYIHQNKGYADPDKKWAVENLISDDELCMILDADEELSVELANEIASKQVQIGKVRIPVYFMGVIVQEPLQPRIFMKKYIEISDTIHDYLLIGDKSSFIVLKTILVNADKKDIGKDIEIKLKKIDKYSSNEDRSDGKVVTFIKMFGMPIIWFFGFGIRHKNFIRGIPGWVHATMMGYYQFVIYAKHYEKTIHSK